MCLGYHWSITMEMMRCQNTGRTKLRKKVKGWSPRTQIYPQESMKSLLYIQHPRCPICLKTYTLPSSQECGCLNYRREIPGPPVLQDPLLDLELAGVLGGFSILLSCFFSQSRSLLLLITHHSCPLWPLQILICSAPTSSGISPRQESDSLMYFTYPVKFSD